MRRFLLLLPVLLLPVLSAGQVLDFREHTIRTITPGLRHGTYLFPVRGGTAEIQSIAVELNHGNLVTTPVLPAQGPNSFVQMRELAEATSSLSAVALLQQPPMGESSELRGFTYIDGRVYSWPPQDAHLVMQLEGTAAFEELPTGTLTGTFDDGTTMTLLSINGALPAGRGDAAVYTGRLDARELPVVAWPSDTMAVMLTPPRTGDDPHDLFLDRDDRNRRFVLQEVVERGRLSVARNQAALIMRPPVSPAIIERVRRQEGITITVAMEERYLLAGSVLPVGTRIMRDGKIVEGASQNEFHNVLALNDGGTVLTALSSSRTMGRGSAVSGEQLASFVKENSLVDVVALRQLAPALLPEVKRPEEHRHAASAQARLLLVFRSGTPTISLPGVVGDLVRLRGIAVDGTQMEFPGNLPGKARDERLSPSVTLDQFWATPFERDAYFQEARPGEHPCHLRLYVAQPRAISVVEIIHAEAVGFSPEFNLKKYRIVGRANANTGWKQLAIYDHKEPERRVRLTLPDSTVLQEIRIEVLEPNFLTNGNVARIAEVFLWVRGE